MGIAIKGGDNIKQYRDKVVFVVWAPDNAPIRDKMMLASSKQPIKREFRGCNYDFQCNRRSELSASSWIKEIANDPTVKRTGRLVEFEGRKTCEWDSELSCGDESCWCGDS